MLASIVLFDGRIGSLGKALNGLGRFVIGVQSFADDFQSLGNLLFKSAVNGMIVLAVDAQVILSGYGVGRFMGVLVADAMPQPLRARVMSILQVDRYWQNCLVPYVLSRGSDGQCRRVAFGGSGEVQDGLSQHELAFREADLFAGLKTAHGQGQCAGIGISNVFAGGDHETSAEEADVFAPFDHPRQPVNRGVRIAAPNAFDQRTGAVIMLAPCHVIALSAVQGRFGDRFIREADGFGLAQHGSFQHREGLARVTVANFDQDVERVGLHDDLQTSKAARGIGQCPLENAFDFGGSQRPELQQLAAADQGRIYGKEGITGGRADEVDHSLLNVGQQSVLLGSVKAMDLVDEKQRSSTGRCELIACNRQDLTEFFNPVKDGIQLDKRAPRFLSQQSGERCLPGSWRPEQEQGTESVILYESREDVARCQQVRLADELV